MKALTRIALIVLMICLAHNAAAQTDKKGDVKPEDMEVDMENPTMEPRVRVTRVLDNNGDSIQCVQLNRVYVYPPIAFKDKKQQQQYNQLVKNVKKVLPIAKEVNGIIIETYEYLQTLPDKKSKDEHMKKVEEAIKRQYTPRMKKLTFAQGKLLIKLVHRECNSSSYQLVQAFLGPVKAGFYQAFAWTFGASLTKKYEPEGKDRLTERVVLMVESGQL